MSNYPVQGGPALPVAVVAAAGAAQGGAAQPVYIVNGLGNSFGGPVNVREYGALGDGTTNDTAAITAAISAAAAANGVVYVPHGTYLTDQQTIYSHMAIVGDGPTASILKLRSGQNTDLLKSNGFDSLTGTNSTGGVVGFALSNIGLDGNKSGQTSGAGAGLRIYGYSYRLENVHIGYCRGIGWVSEWASNATEIAYGPQMESFFLALKIYENTGNGVEFAGPHDSVWVGGLVMKNGTGGAASTNIGIHCKLGTSGTLFFGVHVWGSDMAYAWYIESTAKLIGCVGEGARTAQVLVNAFDTEITGGSFFYLTPTASKGIVIGISGSSPAPAGVKIDTKIYNLTSGSLEFANDGGNNRVEVLAYQSSGTGVLGTPAANTVLRAQIVGGATGGNDLSTQRIPATVVMNTGNFTLTDMPAAITEFQGSSGRRLWVDLTYATQIRLTARVATAGSTSAELRAQWSTDESSWNYFDGGTGPAVAINTNGAKASAWATIGSGARTDVILRIVTINGDGAADPIIGNIAIQVR